mmetsp:Transcript_11108/g.27762  ORF Transcript_11108/g.27762 Transcript_11108/m.27762 type:complete len:254 (-) Transcript_11108:318-1079(-)
MSAVPSIGTEEEPFAAAAITACSAISLNVCRSASDAILAGSVVKTRAIISPQHVTMSPLGKLALCHTVFPCTIDCVQEESEVDQIFSVQSSDVDNMDLPSLARATLYTKFWWPANVVISQPSNDHIFMVASFDAVRRFDEPAEIARIASPCASFTRCTHSVPRKTRSERSCDPVTTSPVGKMATETAWAPASRVCFNSPEFASQTFAFPSHEPVTTCAPRSATEHTGPSWPTYCVTGFPSASTRTAVLSLEPL